MVELRFAQLSFFLLSLATSMRFCNVFPLADTNKILDQTIVTFRQSLTDTCDILYKVLESVKRTVRLLLCSTSPHPLWEHLPLSKGAALWTTRSLRTRRGFPILNGPGTSESRSLTKIFDFSSSSVYSSARANKTRCSDKFQKWTLHAGKQSLPEPLVMILDVEGRLDGRQVIWEGLATM